MFDPALHKAAESFFRGNKLIALSGTSTCVYRIDPNAIVLVSPQYSKRFLFGDVTLLLDTQGKPTSRLFKNTFIRRFLSVNGVPFYSSNHNFNGYKEFASTITATAYLNKIRGSTK